MQGPLELDTDLQKVRVGSREVPLTAKEFSLLEVLMKNPGRIFSREKLFELVWGKKDWIRGQLTSI